MKKIKYETAIYQIKYQKFELAQNPLAYYTNIQARGYVGLARRDLKPQFVKNRIWYINRCLWIVDKFT